LFDAFVPLQAMRQISLLKSMDLPVCTFAAIIKKEDLVIILTA
jgi:hypothetical protein